MTTRPRTILVADDDATVREVLRLMLDLDGHRVAVARDGPEALLRLQEDRPEIVLLDLAMPGLHGLEVCRRIKHAPNPPLVMVISAMDGAEDERAARMAGADAYVRKPFSPPGLLALIDSMAPSAG